ncbi:serine/threonine-protein kinase [Microbacterium sp. 179-I 3D3 NHS]|uniref:serine/threonine-protein kinase n=1 Tax=Microbacterium sp. 179-I 3D3 NHS TaxID=3142382 RepID=UPI0039A204F6
MTIEVVSPTAALLDGRYLLEEPVGRGGMATVYRAEDTHLGRTVAIKMIHNDEGPVDPIERAHNEKAVLASLSHPSLVALFDAQLEPRRPQYLVMEFIDGPTLADRMADGPLPARTVARITRDLAEGLAVAHAAGIVHRDVKPSNVLLTKPRDRVADPGRAKLADFGIACTLDQSRLTSPGIVLGTLTYIAPEQLRGQEPGTACDIFSLGLVVLEALTGERGYSSLVSGRAAAVARLMGPPMIPDGVDPAWRDLLERMTRLEPAQRPTAAEVARLARRLERGGAAERRMPAPAVVSTDPVPAAASVAVVSGGEALPSDGVARAVTAVTAILPGPVGRGRRRRRGTAAGHASTDAGRVRRWIVAGGAMAVVAAATLSAGAMLLSPASSDSGRTAAVSAVRTALEPEVAPEATMSDAPVNEVEAVTVDDPAIEVDAVEPGVADPGNGAPPVDEPADGADDPPKGKGNDNGNGNNGNGNNENGNGNGNNNGNGNGNGGAG